MSVRGIDVDSLGAGEDDGVEFQDALAAMGSPDEGGELWYNAELQQLSALIVHCTFCGKSSAQEVPIRVNKITSEQWQHH